MNTISEPLNLLFWLVFRFSDKTGAGRKPPITASLVVMEDYVGRQFQEVTFLC